MSDDYLWDRSGEPDPEVRRLEELLGRYAHDPSRSARPVRPARTRWVRVALAAAAVVAVAVVGIRLVRGWRVGGFEVVSLEGAPRIGSTPIAGTGTLPVGAWIETDGISRAQIRIGAIGAAELDPNTRVRLLRAELDDHRLSLARGTLHAHIWAPPRLFFVETSSAVAVDLGCSYTLSVDDNGGGLLRVESGWVAFDFDGRESFVPAGAQCATRPGIGPGTPHFEDSSPALHAALMRLDFEGGDLATRERDLDVILGEARPRDALTLWHLLTRVEGDERGRTFDRLAALVPPPAGVTRGGVVGGDRAMIDRYWGELGLKTTSWWGLFEGIRPPAGR